jgi:hypothetical protein
MPGATAGRGVSGATAGDAADGDGDADAASGALAAVRTGRYADLSLFVAVALGVLAALSHPVGVVVGGFLVGVVAPTLRRAGSAGVAFAVVVLTAYAARLLVVEGLPALLSLPPGSTLATVVAVTAGGALAAVVVRTVG